MKTKFTRLFVEFLDSEQASGIILIACTLVSILIANSLFGEGFVDFWHLKAGFDAGFIAIHQTVEHWINDGLMVVFFLLIGRWFQGKTYDSLAFDRDFKSYFPLAVSRRVKDEWKSTVVFELKVNDTIQIRNMEIVPADSLLLDEKAYIDYSFVTGESKPIRVTKGELVYAGGRLIGQPTGVCGRPGMAARPRKTIRCRAIRASIPWRILRPLITDLALI